MDRPLRVLVIDDDEVARVALGQTLRDVGWETFELPSAEGASRVISENNIVAVVLDVMMPGIGGDKLARLLRAGPHGQHLGIVLVSGRPTNELKALAIEAQADSVVNKRDVPTSLAHAVLDACSRRASATWG